MDQERQRHRFKLPFAIDHAQSPAKSSTCRGAWMTTYYVQPWCLFQNHRRKRKRTGPPSAARLTCALTFPGPDVDDRHCISLNPTSWIREICFHPLQQNSQKPLKNRGPVVALREGRLVSNVSINQGMVLTEEKGALDDQLLSQVTRWILLVCTTSAEGF